MATILIIEDDTDLVALLTEALQTWGHDVEVAGDGIHGYEKLYVSAPDYDLVLCDLELPRMPGPTLLRTAARQLRGRTPVIIMTGADRMVDALGETRRWAFGILKKPFKLDHLKEILAHALQQRHVYKRSHEQEQRIGELEERIRDLVTQNQALFEEARLDPLTRLPNRRRFQEDLGRMHANVDRYAASFAIALIDVDDFRRYNEQQGYVGGDRALRRVADLLVATLRQGDTVYRFGGDEFVIVMAAQDIDQGFQVVDRIREEIERQSQTSDPDGSVGRVTISAGVAAVQPGDKRSVADLIRRTDEQLRVAKAAGGNCVYPAVQTTSRDEKRA